MVSDVIRDARAITEEAFAFLVADFGYKRCRRRFQWNGFVLRYCGPVVGIEANWYPRDPFTVWIVKMVDEAFPPPPGPTPRPVTPRFDLGDVEALCGGGGEPQTLDVYAPPDEATAKRFARVLRECGASLLRGDLSLVPALEHRIMERTRRVEELERLRERDWRAWQQEVNKLRERRR